MPPGLTQNAASGNQILLGLPREKYKALTFSRHVMFSSVMSLNDRRSEFSFCIRRELPRLINKERRRRTMAMEIVLELQKLEVPQEEDLFGSSTGSSQSGCCNNQN